MLDGVPHRNRIFEHTSQVGTETRALAGSLRDLAGDLRRVARGRLRDHPYLTLGVAAGCGYVLGGGLPRAFTRLALMGAARVALAQAIGAAAQTRVASPDDGAE